MLTDVSSGNRFQLLHEEGVGSFEDAFDGVTDLELEETLLSWEGIVDIASGFPSLTKLSASLNQFSSIPQTGLGSLTTSLTTLSLEFNEFTSLADLAPLKSLTALKSLQLKGNSISTITPSLDVPQPTFAPSLVFLDVSYNDIASWSFIDDLPNSIPSLTALRISHNPIYNSQSPVDKPSLNAQAKTAEEAYMIAVARLPTLRSLNFSAVSAQERTNAELFYLSRIARQLASVPEDQESGVLTQHPRYASLCEVHGEPDVLRREEINPNFLEARLVKVQFRLEGERARTATTEIPRSFDVYAVKGIAGRIFEKPPLALRLVYETGEWDPVGGYDEQVGDDSEEEDDADARALDEDLRREQEVAAAQGEKVELAGGGQWVKREVELADGPRQLGFCVDGLEATIRVEVR